MESIELSNDLFVAKVPFKLFTERHVEACLYFKRPIVCIPLTVGHTNQLWTRRSGPMFSLQMNPDSVGTIFLDVFPLGEN